MKKNNIEEYQYDYQLGKWILKESSVTTIKELSTFYSSHYGTWSNHCPDKNLRGKRVSLSSNRIAEWLDKEYSELWTVKDNGKLIGYAIALRGLSGSNEKIIWITQFVIHEDYRNTGIGKRLLFSIWGFSDFFAWGLVTANPYAIRALEKATRRRCEPKRIKKNAQQLINFGKKNIGYINDSTEKEISEHSSKINTNFYVDHSEITTMLSNATSEDKPWLLDNIEEGWEWFAFTFNDQIQFELTEKEIEAMLNASDSIVKDAYGRMLMDMPSQKWTGLTEKEIDYIVHTCGLTEKHTILDIGCGMGRHSIELGKRGFNSTGIDYAPSLINSANNKAKTENITCKFMCIDILDNQLPFANNSFDTILCLYDVIGSYADNTKNVQILEQIYNLLRDKGSAVISVMNLHLTEKRAKNTFRLKESSKKLLELKASNTMETSGNIFNPDYYLIDTDTKVVYRKEQFSRNNSFPKELIVRDKRYYMDEISEMCEKVGLSVVQKRFVKAGWEHDLKEDEAKEILLVCRKNL